MYQQNASWILLTVLAVFLTSCGSREDRDGSASSADPPPETVSRTPFVATVKASIPVTESGEVAMTGPGDQGYDLETLQRQSPSAEVDVAIGSLFFRRGELDSALVYYRSATERGPANPGHLNFLGICLARMGRTAEAEDVYAKAEEADPYYPNTYVNQGNIFYVEGDYDKAIHAYNVAVSIDSTDADPWLNLGMAYQKVDKINKAILAYNKAIECAPRDPRPWEGLGWLYYNRRLYAAARERWLEVVERDSTREDLKESIQTLMDYAKSTGTR